MEKLTEAMDKLGGGQTKDVETKEIDSVDALEKQIASYGSFEVMSALTFGFAVSVMFQNFTGNVFDGEDALMVFFGALMSLVLICSAFAMIVMSLTHYFVRRYIAGGEIEMAEQYLILFKGYRLRARQAFYVGLISFLVAVVIYMQPHLEIAGQIIVTLILGLGTICIAMTTYTMLNPNQVVELRQRLSNSQKVSSLRESEENKGEVVDSIKIFAVPSDARGPPVFMNPSNTANTEQFVE